MRRLVPVLCGGVLAAVLSGCASQSTVAREWYEPTEATALKREDGTTVGALKSETVKSGCIRPLRVARPVDEPRLAYGEAEPDWSGNKHFSLFSW